jgi:dolichol-phosphate mannosyltransferase
LGDFLKLELLVLIPTYNEKDNISVIIKNVLDNLPEAHILIVDDNSPDGTAEVVTQQILFNTQIFLLKRHAKLGIGSAHKDGIDWAYDKSYKYLITLDADLTHDATSLPRLLDLAKDVDMVVGSRYLLKGGMEEWTRWRRILSNSGHFASRFFLKLPYDSTNSLRVYNIDRIPQQVFKLIRSNGYAFFFESLFILQKNGLFIIQWPITLAARAIGNSKMSYGQMALSILTLFNLYLKERFSPDYYKYKKSLLVDSQDNLRNHNEWDAYWNSKESATNVLYEILATLFRNIVIKPKLTSVISKYLKQGSKALHAGCGSGEVDIDIRYRLEIKGVDISLPAVHYYNQLHFPFATATKDNILSLTLSDNTFDLVYNLGVMEHLTDEEIRLAMEEFKRVLRPGGYLILFWPHQLSPMRLMLKAYFKLFGTMKDSLIPPEINRIKSRAQVKGLAQKSGLLLKDYYFGLSDFYTQSVIVLQKP